MNKYFLHIILCTIQLFYIVSFAKASEFPFFSNRYGDDFIKSFENFVPQENVNSDLLGRQYQVYFSVATGIAKILYAWQIGDSNFIKNNKTAKNLCFSISCQLSKNDLSALITQLKNIKILLSRKSLAVEGKRIYGETIGYPLSTVFGYIENLNDIISLSQTEYGKNILSESDIIELISEVSSSVLYGSMPQNIYQMENFRSYTKELRKFDEKVDKKHLISMLNFSITKIYNTDFKADSDIMLYCALSSGISCVLRAWLNGNYIEISKNRVAGNLCSYINRNFPVNSIYELIDQLIFLKKACLAESIDSINKGEFHMFNKPHLEKCLLNLNDKFGLLMLSYIDDCPSVDIYDINLMNRILSKAQKKLNSFFENIT